MYQKSDPRGDSPVSIIGAGIAGAWQALLFAQAGHAVTLYERSDADMTLSTSHWAGGMLAPWCEAETSEPVIGRLGIRSLDLWREHFPDTPFNGSLVVAHARDRADFERFAKLTSGHVRLDAQGLGELEPSLDGRFRDGLFYAGEGHVEPRKVLPELHARIEAAGGTIKFDCDADAEDLDGIVIDCRGLVRARRAAGAARRQGRDDHRRDERGRTVAPGAADPSALAALCDPARRQQIHAGRDLDRGRGHRRQRALGAGAAWARPMPCIRLLPRRASSSSARGFARPIPDNLPRITIGNDQIAVNGLYRHGFLLAPALAELTLGYVQRGAIDNEVMRCV